MSDMTKAHDTAMVTQADRDAAADFYDCPQFEDLANGCRLGMTDHDADGLVQAFARHRTASQAELLVALEGLLRRIEESDHWWMGSYMDEDGIRAIIARIKGEQS